MFEKRCNDLVVRLKKLESTKSAGLTGLYQLYSTQIYAKCVEFRQKQKLVADRWGRLDEVPAAKIRRPHFLCQPPGPELSVVKERLRDLDASNTKGPKTSSDIFHLRRSSSWSHVIKVRHCRKGKGEHWGLQSVLSRPCRERGVTISRHSSQVELISYVTLAKCTYYTQFSS